MKQRSTLTGCSPRVSLHAIALVLAACGGAQRGSEAEYTLEVFYPDAQAGLKGKVGKHFNAKPTAHCMHMGSEARWAMTGATHDQAMPSGLTLEDGQIAGVPKQAGTYTVHIVFHGLSCGSKPFPDQAVDVTLTIGA